MNVRMPLAGEALVLAHREGQPQHMPVSEIWPGDSVYAIDQTSSSPFRAPPAAPARVRDVKVSRLPARTITANGSRFGVAQWRVGSGVDSWKGHPLLEIAPPPELEVIDPRDARLLAHVEIEGWILRDGYGVQIGHSGAARYAIRESGLEHRGPVVYDRRFRGLAERRLFVPPTLAQPRETRRAIVDGVLAALGALPWALVPDYSSAIVLAALARSVDINVTISPAEQVYRVRFRGARIDVLPDEHKVEGEVEVESLLLQEEPLPADKEPTPVDLYELQLDEPSLSLIVNGVCI